MPGEATVLGPFSGGLHNVPGSGEFIHDDELYAMMNLEVDTDGTIANRPEISDTTISAVAPNGTGWSFIGTYYPNDGRKFIVVNLVAVNQIRLIDTATNTMQGTNLVGNATSCVQYDDKLWVTMTQQSATNGGYFSCPTGSTVASTVVPSMPRGESMAVYRERIWIACGVGATNTTSRFFFSAVADGTTWSGTDYVDCNTGNGEKLTSLIRMGTDLVLFKEHSTYRFTYTTDPRKAQLDPVDPNVGAPRVNCIAIFNNNTIYVLHDNSVYELFQYTYTEISNPLNMVKESDLDLYGKDEYCLSIFRNRLFVRYFKHLYVFGLDTKVWCEWVSARKFSYVVGVRFNPNSPDIAYCHTASQANSGKCYTFRDDRQVTYDGGITYSTVQMPGSGQASQSAISDAIAVPAGAVAGDWVYIFHVNLMLMPGGIPSPTTVTPPVGFDVVVPYTAAGDPSVRGLEWSVYRKKWVAGETSYTLTFSQIIPYRDQIVLVRGSSDCVIGTIKNGTADQPYADLVTDPMVGPVGTLFVGLFGAATTTSAAVSVTHTGMSSVVMSPVTATVTSSLAAIGNNRPADGRFLGSTMAYTPAVPSTTISVVLAMLPTSSPTPAGAEVFTGDIVTKTYDFEIAHQYKVQFWWGINIATSGSFRAGYTVPNAKPNYTWGSIKLAFANWGEAKAAGVTWGGVANVTLTESVSPALGRYARKFVKLFKKLRFRQIYYTLSFDVLTNKGIADASLRIYDLRTFIKAKETVVKETT